MMHLLYIPLYALYVAGFLLLIYKARFFNIPDVKRNHLAFFFLLKVAAGIALTLVYTYYYTDPTKADIYRYFTDSKIISSLLFTHPVDWLKIITGIGTYDPQTFKYLQDTLYFTHPVNDLVTDNTLFIRVISILNYFSFYNIYIDTLLFNCIAFVALTALFKALSPFFSEFPQILFWPLFLMPSVVFWSSGLLKEELLFVGIALYIYAATKPSTGINWKNLLFIFMAILLVALTKIYVGLIMVLCGTFLPTQIEGKTYRSGIALKYGVYIGMGILVWLYAGDYLSSNIIYKRNEFIQLAIAEHSNSILDTTIVTGGWNSIFALVPSAFENAILRPFVRDKGTVFQLLFAVENFLFIASLIFLLLRYFKWPEKIKLFMALFCFSFAVLNYLSIGITIPILGAIVHYRVIAMPFLLLSVLLMTNLERLKFDYTRLLSSL